MSESQSKQNVFTSHVTHCIKSVCLYFRENSEYDTFHAVTAALNSHPGKVLTGFLLLGFTLKSKEVQVLKYVFFIT